MFTSKRRRLGSTTCSIGTHDQALRHHPASARSRAIFNEKGVGRRSAAKLLTKDEARRIAANIAKLPEAGAQGVRTKEKPPPLPRAVPSWCGVKLRRPNLAREKSVMPGRIYRNQGREFYSAVGRSR